MHPIHLVRHIGLVEGVSFLVLVLIAMPLKYFYDQPLAVKYVGWAHGVLFVALAIAVLGAMVVARLSIGRAVLVMVAALLPAGPFLIDSHAKRWAAEYDAGRAVT